MNGKSGTGRTLRASEARRDGEDAVLVREKAAVQKRDGGCDGDAKA